MSLALSEEAPVLCEVCLPLNITARVALQDNFGRDAFWG